MNENGDVPIYIQLGKNIGTGMTFFIAICEHTALPSYSTLTGTRNYKDQTDSKLPESDFCAHIILTTHVPKGRHGKGMQLNIGGVCIEAKIKHRKAVQQVDSGFMNAVF